MEVQYKFIDSLDELKHLSPDVETFADVESGFLYKDLRLIQLYQPAIDPMIYFIDTDVIDEEEAKEFIKPLWTIWHNASYDFGTLNMTTARFDDTQYLCRLAYPQWQKFSLDDVVSFLGFNNLYEGLDKKKLQKAGFKKGAYLSNDQLRYAATDVYALSLIWKNHMVQKCRQVLAYKVDILSMGYAIEYQQNGLIPDQEAVRLELDKLVDIIAENYQKLDGLNPNSPKQVKAALGTESSNKETLIRLMSMGGHTGELAKLVFDQRRLLKRQTMLNSYNYPKVYTRFNAAGAATSRFTSSGGDLDTGINAQQIPRDLQYIFNTDTEDTVVIHADYSTAELRAAASIMNEPVMYQELKADIDLHKAAASLVTGNTIDKCTKAERQKGKSVSFGFIFGMSAPAFVEYAYTNYGVIFTLEEAQEIKKKYTTKYTSINKYHRRWWNDYKDVLVTTPLGHRNKPRLGTDAINYATQGCIAETTKLAVHYLCKEYPEVTKYIFNIVHDAVYMRVPRGTEGEWADRLIVAMKKGWEEMCKLPMLNYKDIPMPVEVEYLDIVREV